MLAWSLTYSAKRNDFGVERVLVGVAAAVAVELDVRDVAAMSFERLHRFERGAPVAGHAQVVAVDVHRVRQTQLVHRRGHTANDLSRRHVEANRRSGRSLWTLPAAWCFQTSTPPGLTSLTA